MCASKGQFSQELQQIGILHRSKGDLDTHITSLMILRYLYDVWLNVSILLICINYKILITSTKNVRIEYFLDIV